MGFLLTIVRSIYSPEFYASVPRRSFWSGIGYFLVLTLLLSIVHVATVAGGLMTVSDQIKAGADILANSYPPDLVVDIRGGRVSTNATEPYLIRVPSQFADSGMPANMVVIDTKTPFSTTRFKNYDTLAWITSDAVVVDGKVYDLSSVGDFSVDRTQIDKLAAAISPWLQWIGPVLAVGAAVAIYLSYVLRLVYLLVLALVIWVMAGIFKWGFEYAVSYKVGLYAMTPALLLEMVVNLTKSSTGFNGFPFMFSLVTLVALVLNMTASKSVTSGLEGTEGASSNKDGWTVD